MAYVDEQLTRVSKSCEAAGMTFDVLLKLLQHEPIITGALISRDMFPMTFREYEKLAECLGESQEYMQFGTCSSYPLVHTRDKLDLQALAIEVFSHEPDLDVSMRFRMLTALLNSNVRAPESYYTEPVLLAVCKVWGSYLGSRMPIWDFKTNTLYMPMLDTLTEVYDSTCFSLPSNISLDSPALAAQITAVRNYVMASDAYTWALKIYKKVNEIMCNQTCGDLEDYTHKFGQTGEDATPTHNFGTPYKETK